MDPNTLELYRRHALATAATAAAAAAAAAASGLANMNPAAAAAAAAIMSSSQYQQLPPHQQQQLLHPLLLRQHQQVRAPEPVPLLLTNLMAMAKAKTVPRFALKGKIIYFYFSNVSALAAIIRSIKK
jgi:hypothetical protein